MLKLSDDTIKEMRKRYYGKKISVTNERGDVFLGNCFFLGYNPHIPSWNFQVTVAGTPVPHCLPNSIKLI
jgi:hypothetical protein